MYKKRVRKQRQRGVPPPPTFSLAALSDDTVLRQIEVAAVKRESLAYTEKKRYLGTDGLDWRYIGGRPRCTAGSLKRVMQSDAVRLRAPQGVEPTTKPQSVKATNTKPPSKLRSSADVNAKPRPPPRLQNEAAKDSSGR